MPKRRIPKYSLHKATGQTRVFIDGRDHYLGPHGSEESKRRYRELIDDWRLRNETPAACDLTIGQLVLLYDNHIREHYVKDGKQTSEVLCIQIALRPLVAMFGKIQAGDFGPSKLIAVRKKMIDAGRERKSINRNIGRIVRMFKWGVAQELCRAEVVTALECVQGLQRGRSKAVETPPVKPVPIDRVEAIRGHVTRPVWGMIRFQLATGCRPGEAVLLRGCDITMTGSVWEYRPESHKTEHHDKKRIILIGPQGKEVVREFLKTDLSAYLFSPQAADKRRNKARANRPGKRYRRDSYATAIRRACEIVFGMPEEIRNIPKALKSIPDAEQAAERNRLKQMASEWRTEHCWAPNQLRHTAATLIRAKADLDTARTVLGHSSTVITEVYAERDLEAARKIVAQIG